MSLRDARADTSAGILDVTERRSRHGWAGHGEVRRGSAGRVLAVKAWNGVSGQGDSWRVKFWRSRFGLACRVRSTQGRAVNAWKGRAGLGGFRRSRRGRARWVVLRRVMSWPVSSVGAAPGVARLGGSRRSSRVSLSLGQESSATSVGALPGVFCLGKVRRRGQG